MAGEEERKSDAMEFLGKRQRERGKTRPSEESERSHTNRSVPEDERQRERARDCRLVEGSREPEADRTYAPLEEHHR